MNYRNPKLLALAKGAPCMARILTVCNHNPETTVACHSNLSRHGKGMGLKGHDCFVAFCCSDCHDVLDRRRKNPGNEPITDIWQRAHEATELYLWQNVLVKVA